MEFRIVAVSKNHNSFGLRRRYFLGHDGRAFTSCISISPPENETKYAEGTQHFFDISRNGRTGEISIPYPPGELCEVVPRASVPVVVETFGSYQFFIRVYFSDGDEFSTTFNATSWDEVEAHYLGKEFEKGDETRHRCIRIKNLDP